MLKKILSWLPVVAVVAAVLILPSQYRSILDWWALRNYQPPARVVELADSTTMSDTMRRTFYVYKPKLEDGSTFRSHCLKDGHEKTIVLGCYISNKGIFIFDVSDERLKGIHEVTAAHEALHASYDRLKGKDKKRIDELLNQTYAQVTNSRIKDAIESYKSAGADVTNELHSILGTELRDLPPELEDYYKRYFNNRIKIVEYAEKYAKTFTDLEQKVAEYDAELARLKAQIEANEARLKTMNQELSIERSRLDALLAAGRNDEYNEGVDRYNAKVRDYNSLADQTRRLVERHNKMAEERNAIAVQHQELAEALDSDIEQAP